MPYTYDLPADALNVGPTIKAAVGRERDSVRCYLDNQQVIDPQSVAVPN